jgi:hypothetical protein
LAKKVTRLCPQCNKIKDLRSFGVDKRKKDKVSKMCLACTKLKYPKSEIEPKIKKPKKVIMKPVDIIESIKVPAKTLDTDTEVVINTRFKNMLVDAFGTNLELIVEELKKMLKDKALSHVSRLAVINIVLDRVLGKPVQEQHIKQEVVQVSIKRPDLSVIDVTPKE